MLSFLSRFLPGAKRREMVRQAKERAERKQLREKEISLMEREFGTRGHLRSVPTSPKVVASKRTAVEDDYPTFPDWWQRDQAKATTSSADSSSDYVPSPSYSPCSSSSSSDSGSSYGSSDSGSGSSDSGSCGGDGGD